MADGSAPVRKKRGKRSHIGDQIRWVMLQEVEAGRIRPDGFVLLEKPALVALVQARLTAAGVPEDTLAFGGMTGPDAELHVIVY
jgi:hypothetical protein